MYEVDASDLKRLAAEFGRAANIDLLDKVEPTLKRSMGDLKSKMRADMGASRHFGQVAAVIDYDIDKHKYVIQGEVGAVTGGRVVGDLGHIAYYGGRRGGGGTVRDPEEYLASEGSTFARYAEQAYDDLVREFT